MRDTVWIKADKAGVRGMTKGMPQTARGELAVKISIEIDPDCWGTPTLEQSIHITDWRDGLTFPDVRLDQMTITAAEAERIKSERAAEAAAQLRALGYKVEAPVQDAEE